MAKKSAKSRGAGRPQKKRSMGKKSGGSHSKGQSSARGSTAKSRSSAGGGSASRSPKQSGGKKSSQAKGRSGGQQQGEAGGMTGKVVAKAKSHPMATAATAAGVGMMLVEGVRRALTAADAGAAARKGGLRDASQRDDVEEEDDIHRGASADREDDEEADDRDEADDQADEEEEEGEEDGDEAEEDEDEDETTAEYDQDEDADDDADEDEDDQEGDEAEVEGSADEEEDDEDDGDEDEAEASDEDNEEDEEYDDEADGDDAGEEEEEGAGVGQRVRRGLAKIGSVFGGSGQRDEEDDEDEDSGERDEPRRARPALNLGGADWYRHPLVICATAAAVGVAAAYLLPSTAIEDRTMGPTADRVNRRLRKASKGLIGKGKGVVTRAISEAVSAVAEEAEREGLTPDRLGRKVKRIASHVRDAVADAVDEE
jgi:hypothetical protein